MPPSREFRVAVTKDSLVFAAAHFITFPGHRCETLHGHNYRTRVAVEGGLDAQAHFVLDFSELKRLAKRLVDEIDHKVLLPLENPKIQVAETGASITVAYQGTPRYVFPKTDCALLPIPNTTVEMLAQYLAGRLSREIAGLGGDAVRLKAVEVEIEENFGQSATYRETLT
jgi:6-pyruvoyltetrahydropterin/6-carboxytetrahydropterin synthase